MPTRSGSPDVWTLAAHALESLKALAEALDIDDAIPPKQLAATRVSNRVPTEAMRVAVAILTKDPKKYPHFDAARAQGAIDFEEAMVPVADATLALSKRIRKGVLKRRSEMANETLSLYQMAKGAARLAPDEETRMQLRQLKELLTTNRGAPREERLTVEETKALVKAHRSEKRAAKARAKAADAENALETVKARAAVEAIARGDGRGGTSG